MADTKSTAPQNAELAQSIINEGQKAAAQAKPVDQNAVKAQAVAASQPNPGQPEAPAAAFAQAAHQSGGYDAAQAAEFAEFQKWKASRTQPATTQAAPAQAPQPADIEKEYGAGFVTASRAGVTQHFTAKTWRALGGDQNKDGYKRVVSTPPEVSNLKK